MNRVSIGLLLAVLVGLGAGCADNSAAGAEGDGGAPDLTLGTPIDLVDAGDCVMVVHETGGGRVCVAEWSCLEAGVLALGCSVQDALSCTCGREDQAGTPVAGAPVSCSAADVTTFARAACGWSWL